LDSKREQDRNQPIETSNKEQNTIFLPDDRLIMGDIIGELTTDKKIVIDDYSEDPNWVRCYTIDYNCNIIHGFIKRSPVLEKQSLFFSLGLFDSLSLFVAMIIFVVVALPLLYIGALINLFRGGGFIGIILCVLLVLGLVYIAYNLLENILYELFLINLPY